MSMRIFARHYQTLDPDSEIPPEDALPHALSLASTGRGHRLAGSQCFSFSALLVRLLAPPSFGLFDGVDGEGFELGGQLAEAAGVVEPVPVTVELLGG